MTPLPIRIMGSDPISNGGTNYFFEEKIKNDQHDERNFFASSVFWSELKKYKTFQKQWELIDWPIRLLFEPIRSNSIRTSWQTNWSFLMAVPLPMDQN